MLGYETEDAAPSDWPSNRPIACRPLAPPPPKSNVVALAQAVVKQPGHTSRPVCNQDGRSDVSGNKNTVMVN